MVESRKKGCSGYREPWTPFADDVIVSMYAERGAKACQALLPGRTVMAIQQRAHKLRVVSRVNPNVPGEILYPREPEEATCDLALRQFKEAEPTQNLTWRIAA